MEGKRENEEEKSAGGRGEERKGRSGGEGREESFQVKKRIPWV